MFIDNYKKINGFTFIEIIVVIGILLIVSSISIPLYGGFQGQITVREDSIGLMNSLRVVRERSIAGLHDSAYGIFLELTGDKKYTIYMGSVYASRDTDYDLIIDLNDNLEITNELGGVDINFTKQTGAPSRNGDIIFSSDEITKTVEISSLGTIFIN